MILADATKNQTRSPLTSDHRNARIHSMMNRLCLNCNNQFKIKYREHKYCSSTCAALVNNKKYPRVTGPKRQIYNKCNTCGTNFLSKYAENCTRCFNLNKLNFTGTLKIEDVLANKKQQSLYVRIRQHAKALMIYWGIEKSCTICGYNKYIEVCHFKPISSFLKTSTLAQVNSITNLIYLCVLHHKELDKDLLDPKDKLLIAAYIADMEKWSH